MRDSKVRPWLKRFVVVTLVLVLGICAFSVWIFARGTEAQGAREPASIRVTLKKCVDGQNRTPGIVVGLLDENGTNVYAYGKRERGKEPEVNGDTLFEIGSITKVFTTIVLQDMVEHGEVKLEDPISKYLPASVKTPDWHGKQITLLDLATHTAGFPSVPDNMTPKDGDNPYADYSVQQMYDFLAEFKLPRKPGRKFEYSNYGMGLLGHILALRANTNYESLLVERICNPLHMDSTRMTLSRELRARLATGHSTVGPPVKYWDSLALQGDGALYSTVNDLLKFLAANMGNGPSNLVKTMAKTHVPLRRSGIGEHIGLGWINISFLGADYVWHNGGTGGFCSYIGFDSKKLRGAVLLVNEANTVDDVGLYLFLPQIYDSIDKFKAPQQRAIANIDRHIYNGYAGRYNFNARKFMTITCHGEHLIAQENGEMEWPCEIFPESETEFFFTFNDAQVTFSRDQTGAVTGLVLHQEGKNRKAKKVE